VRREHGARERLFHQGTLVEIHLNRDQIANFSDMRSKALASLRLDEGLDEDDTLFE
jgi:hypothetical protein